MLQYYYAIWNVIPQKSSALLLSVATTMCRILLQHSRLRGILYSSKFLYRIIAYLVKCFLKSKHMRGGQMLVVVFPIAASFSHIFMSDGYRYFQLRYFVKYVLFIAVSL